jgi:hypothetical protein
VFIGVLYAYSRLATYYGQWLSQIGGQTSRKFASIDQKAALARRFSTGFSACRRDP